MVDRIWLDVPYVEKDLAKAEGARWDPSAKRWYAPRVEMAGLARWAALPDIPETLPGEDRSLGRGLFVDLVPDTCWFTNVRYCVEPKDWERLRRTVTRRAEMKCEICGSAEDKRAQRWLEVHERWHYDWPSKVQRLGRLICLCTPCHQTTHFGYAQLRGYEEEALQHLTDVTGMSRTQARQHVAAAFDEWRARSFGVWTLDLSILTDVGIEVRRPPAAEDRRVIAHTLTAAPVTESPRAPYPPQVAPLRAPSPPAMSPPTRLKWRDRIAAWWRSR